MHSLSEKKNSLRQSVIVLYSVQKREMWENSIKYFMWHVQLSAFRYLENLFSVSQNDNYNLRSNQTKLNLPKPKKNFLKRRFSYRATKCWNFHVKPKKITIIFQLLYVVQTAITSFIRNLM
jgi:hypothetical protein